MGMFPFRAQRRARAAGHRYAAQPGSAQRYPFPQAAVLLIPLVPVPPCPSNADENVPPIRQSFFGAIPLDCRPRCYNHSRRNRRIASPREMAHQSHRGFFSGRPPRFPHALNRPALARAAVVRAAPRAESICPKSPGPRAGAITRAGGPLACWSWRKGDSVSAARARRKLLFARGPFPCRDSPRTAGRTSRFIELQIRPPSRNPGFSFCKSICNRPWGVP